MKASLSWLNEYVSIEMETDALADALTMAGLEVESVSDRYDYLDSVVSGRIVDIHPHPNSDELTVCAVDVGDRKVSIVCGAPNVQKDLVVPVAFPGTRFPEGFVLENKAVRGVISDGMLCSEMELELGADTSGIMILEPGTSIGVSLARALNLSDTVLEIDLTPNRPDCLSIIGIAREIAALQKTQLRYPDIHVRGEEGSISDSSSVTIDVPDHCPRYAARLLTDITVAPSPFWLQDRLLSIGLRPINNIVDITNFVMMETGQPLHAFDFDRLAQHRIVVRLAKQREALATLDQEQHELTDEMLLICDGEKPVALAGIMGGRNSEIEAGSTKVLIESAYFNPLTIRKASKKLGIISEASHRFERGVDPKGTLVALNRAALLMAGIGGGAMVGGAIDQHPKSIEPTRIRLGIDDTNRFLGINLQQDEIGGLLESIEFKVDHSDSESLEVIHPSFRVDIDRPVDLMEEVARLWGYNNISTTYPLIPAIAKPLNNRLYQRNRIKNILVSLGFSEAINYSFIHPLSGDRMGLDQKDSRRKVVAVLNPLSEEQAVMRTSLIPGILDTMGKNIAQQVRNLRLFEVGNIFIHTEKDRQPEETEMLLGLWTGDREEMSWYDRRTECDFYDIKGVVEGLFDGLDIRQAKFTGAPLDLCRYTLGGVAASIQVENDIVGLVGQLHPKVLDNYDLKQPAFIFELNLGMLYNHITDDKQSRSISAYPATSRDVTLIVDKGVESGALLEHVHALGEVLVESLHFFDVFDGDPIPPSKKSVSFRMTYRSETETLADDRVNDIHRKLTEGLLEAFDATFPT